VLIGSVSRTSLRFFDRENKALPLDVVKPRTVILDLQVAARLLRLEIKKSRSIVNESRRVFQMENSKLNVCTTCTREKKKLYGLNECTCKYIYTPLEKRLKVIALTIPRVPVSPSFNVSPSWLRCYLYNIYRKINTRLLLDASNLIPSSS